KVSASRVHDQIQPHAVSQHTLSRRHRPKVSDRDTASTPQCGIDTDCRGQNSPVHYFYTAALEDECSTAFTEYVDVLRLVFRACRDRHPFELTAAVILPGHLHCILALPAGDGARAARWRLLQAFPVRVGGARTDT